MTAELDSILSQRLAEADGRPLVIGIGGGSGSGKSTIAAMLVDGLAPLRVEILAQDRFFKAPEDMPTYRSDQHGDERPDFNHPLSFDRHALIAACRAVDDCDVAIVEGILVLHHADIRALMDLRCYVTVELDEMLRRRTERNLAVGYGGTRDEIGWYNAECVTPQHRRYNAPTARHADVIVPNDDDAAAERDRIIDRICSAVAVAVATARRPDRS